MHNYLPGTETHQDASNLRQIGLATTQFAQDNNETLPPTNDYTAFENALEPYLKDTSVFVSPGTGLPYILNLAISGASFADIPSPSMTDIARDARPNPDGSLNHLEVDGHIHPELYFVPKSLTIGSDNRTHLFWPKVDQMAALWTLSSSGITKTTDTLDTHNSAVAFSLGVDDKTRILWHHSYSNWTYDLPITGAITLDTIGTDDTLETSTQFGPYDGWAALLLTTGTDNSSRLLWQRYDGTLALWTLSSEGDYLGSVPLPRLGGGIPVGLALGTDGLTRFLWKTAQGSGKLWIISENGQLIHSFSVPTSSGGTLTALSLGADGASRILWSDGAGKAAVVTLRANGSFVSNVTFALPGGGTASQIAVGKSGDLRVLWEAAEGSGQLQTLTAGGKQISVQSLTPYL